MSKVTKTSEIKTITRLIAFLFVFWGFYRFLFKLPDSVEELLIKPLIWGIPVLYIVFFVEKKGLASLGFSLKNLFPSIYLSLGLGVIFVVEALFVNFMKYQSFNFAANIGEAPLFASFGITLATALTEETTFRGYVFNRLLTIFGNELWANLVTSAVWAMIHVPVAVFVWDFQPVQVATYLMLTTIFGIGSAFVFARTKNILSSVLLHVLWEWPIILFR